MRNNKNGLCYVVKIDHTEAIEGKDRIVMAYNDHNNLGAIISKEDIKKDKYFVLFEADSLIPSDYENEDWNKFFSFLTFCKKSTCNFYKISPRRLGGAVSMGLLIPLSEIPMDNEKKQEIYSEYESNNSYDLTQYYKLEKQPESMPMNAKSCVPFYCNLYHGKKYWETVPKYRFPSQFLDHSDEENLFNCDQEFIDTIYNKECYVSTKMDGTSITLGITDDDENGPIYNVFGHSMMCFIPQVYRFISEKLTEDGKNIFDLMLEYETKTGNKIFIGGEFVGTKIQTNTYKMDDDYNFFIYRVVIVDGKSNKAKYLGLNDLVTLCTETTYSMVPIIAVGEFSRVISKVFNIESNKFETIRDGLQSWVENFYFNKNDYTKYLDEGDKNLHEGIVVTSVNGHSNSLNPSNDEWSFKVKGQKYQTLHS